LDIREKREERREERREKREECFFWHFCLTGRLGKTVTSNS
jgi:hypothetical protein